MPESHPWSGAQHLGVFCVLEQHTSSRTMMHALQVSWYDFHAEQAAGWQLTSLCSIQVAAQACTHPQQCRHQRCSRACMSQLVASAAHEA